MIVKEEFIFKDGRKGTKTYSDKVYKEIEKINQDGESIIIQEHYKIRKIGTDEIYDEAIDVESSNYEYIETDEKIELEVT